MIARERQGGERRVLQVFLLSRIILPRAPYSEIALPKQNEILRVNITIRPLVRLFACLIQLRLQVRPRIESRV
eukprot:CAMPEP_0196218578 /NCGR_PEP_ID=MMETSP0912-20130531/36848_1 /TAXON_ID=49265 /ORGANISM="Thalassiosira rotula, Strain GSO102" /LENGTH=72 /DNA_ID=CAMNT_0041496281 /DNA_START=178 /DNA_END=393 /DNA_ORIENTATION=-